MKKIIKPRQYGKTSELIKMAEETNAYIITPNRAMALNVSDMAEAQNHNILFPVTLKEYMRYKFKGSYVKNVLIDDADIILQEIFSDVTIEAITMTADHPQEDNWIPVSERLPEDLEAVNITWVNHNPESYYMDIKDKPFTATGHYCKGRWYWYSSTCQDYLKEYGRCDVDEIDTDIEVTAWMPLPESYTESEK